MFTETLFKTAKNWQHLKCSSSGMDKQTCGIPYDWILFCNKNEWQTDMCNNVVNFKSVMPSERRLYTVWFHKNYYMKKEESRLHKAKKVWVNLKTGHLILYEEGRRGREEGREKEIILLNWSEHPKSRGKKSNNLISLKLESQEKRKRK